MSPIHDYIIKCYSVDFEAKKIVLDVSNDIEDKRVIFHNFFCYKFYDEMPYSIILDLEERSLDDFFSENKELLEEEKKRGWPIMYDTFDELESESRSANVSYQVLYSSYGLNGWVLANHVEIISK